MQITSTHIHLICDIKEVLLPRIDVQLHTDHWDKTQKPDILDHVGPQCQLYTLIFENANLAQDHRQQDNVMCGLCTCVCVPMSHIEGEPDKRGVAERKVTMRFEHSEGV